MITISELHYENEMVEMVMNMTLLISASSFACQFVEDPRRI